MKPLAAWDTRDGSWMVAQRQARADWLRRHGLPAGEMYRAEFYLIDAPFVRVFTYHRNEQGKRHFTDAHVNGPHDHDRCGPATNPPYDQPVWELPPDDLR